MFIQLHRMPNPESSFNTRAPTETAENPVEINAKTKKLLFFIKAIIGLVFMVLMLGSSVLGKLTLVSLADHLRHATYYPNASTRAVSTEERTEAVTLYWYFQLVLLIPNFITFIRCLAFGVVGKTTKTFPWPTGKAVAMVSLWHI